MKYFIITCILKYIYLHQFLQCEISQLMYNSETLSYLWSFEYKHLIYNNLIWICCYFFSTNLQVENQGNLIIYFILLSSLQN